MASWLIPVYGYKERVYRVVFDGPGFEELAARTVQVHCVFEMGSKLGSYAFKFEKAAKPQDSQATGKQ